MATTYKATQKVSCWKQHRCAQCGSLFRYAFGRTLVGQGATAEQASKNLESVTTKALATDSDLHPCPQCGMIQPDMSAQSKRRSLLWILLATLVLGFLLVILGASGATPPSNTAWILALFGLLMAAATYFVLGRNPNADPRANLAKAAAAVTNGRLAVDEVRNQAEASRSRVGSAVGLGLLVTLGVSVVALPLAELMRATSGWPVNPDFHFPVVGPGDTARFSFAGSITAVKSTWNGIGRVQVANGLELPLEAAAGFRVTSHTETWGSTIRVKSSEKNNSVTPYVDVEVPNLPALAGKQVRLKLSLRTNFPSMESGGSSWRERTQDFAGDTTLVLASPGAGKTYETLWYFGTIVGVLGISTVAFLARRNLAQLLGTTLNAVFAPPSQPAAHP